MPNLLPHKFSTRLDYMSSSVPLYNEQNWIEDVVNKPLKMDILNLLISNQSNAIQSHTDLFCYPSLKNNAVISKLRIRVSYKSEEDHTYNFVVDQWSWSIIKYRKQYYLNKISMDSSYQICVKEKSILCMKDAIQIPGDDNYHFCVWDFGEESGLDHCAKFNQHCEYTKDMDIDYCEHVQLVNKYLTKQSKGINDQLFQWLLKNDCKQHHPHFEKKDKWQWMWVRSKSSPNVWINKFNQNMRHKIQPCISNNNRGIRIISKYRHKYFVCRDKILDQIIYDYQQFILDIQNNITEPSMCVIKELLSLSHKLDLQIIHDILKNISPNTKTCGYCKHNKRLNHQWVRCIECGLIYCCRRCQKKHWNQQQFSHKMQCLQRQNLFKIWT